MNRNTVSRFAAVLCLAPAAAIPQQGNEPTSLELVGPDWQLRDGVLRCKPGDFAQVILKAYTDRLGAPDFARFAPTAQSTDATVAKVAVEEGNASLAVVCGKPGQATLQVQAGRASACAVIVSSPKDVADLWKLPAPQPCKPQIVASTSAKPKPREAPAPGGQTINVRAIFGGVPTAQITDDALGDFRGSQKQVGKVFFTPIVLTLGPEDVEMMRWLAAWINGDTALRSVTFTAQNKSLQVAGAGISFLEISTGRPGRGASMQVGIIPNQSVQGTPLAIEPASPVWGGRASVSVSGLPTASVSRIETAVRGPGDGGVGGIQSGNLVLEINGADVAAWIAWAEDFLVQGNFGPDKLRTATLELIANNGKQRVALTAAGVGVVSVTPLPGNPPKARAELYVNKWSAK